MGNWIGLFSRGVGKLCHNLIREAVKVFRGKSSGWVEGEAEVYCQVLRPNEDKVGYKTIWSQLLPDEPLLLISWMLLEKLSTLHRLSSTVHKISGLCSWLPKSLLALKSFESLTKARCFLHPLKFILRNSAISDKSISCVSGRKKLFLGTNLQVVLYKKMKVMHHNVFPFFTLVSKKLRN